MGTISPWFDWSDFNGGAALSANLRAANACITTDLAVSVGGLAAGAACNLVTHFQYTHVVNAIGRMGSSNIRQDESAQKRLSDGYPSHPQDHAKFGFKAYACFSYAPAFALSSRVGTVQIETDAPGASVSPCSKRGNTGSKRDSTLDLA
jgi:hypothetical protein